MVKFEVNTDALDRLGKEIAVSGNKAAHLVAQQVAKDTSPFVPFLTGSLDARTHVKENSVIYPGPYARYLYYGKLMVDPNTGSSFAPKGGTKVLTDRDLVFTKAFHAQAQAYWFEASKAQNIDKWLKVAKKAVTSGIE